MTNREADAVVAYNHICNSAIKFDCRLVKLKDLIAIHTKLNYGCSEYEKHRLVQMYKWMRRFARI